MQQAGEIVLKSTLVELMFVLRTLTPEPMPDELPMVLIVPSESMPCPCEAAYDDRKLYIRNDINWTDPRWLSVVVHELVHHRQFVRRGDARDCIGVARPRAGSIVRATAVPRRDISGLAARHVGYLPITNSNWKDFRSAHNSSKTTHTNAILRGRSANAIRQLSVTRGRLTSGCWGREL
jgi:hypothetical protein